LTKLLYYKPWGSKNNDPNVKKESEMALSDRLRTIVCDLKISQTKFADTLGVSFTYINCLINGKRGNISQSLAILIQVVYGYAAKWILYEEGNVLKKIIRRTLKTRPRMVALQNTFTKEEIDMVMDHIEYIINETVTNITNKLADIKSSKDNKQ
jgi:transcriptional regulator with XRE-family HTH domain